VGREGNLFIPIKYALEVLIVNYMLHGETLTVCLPITSKPKMSNLPLEFNLLLKVLASPAK
jgi:hypothetical protein